MSKSKELSVIMSERESASQTQKNLSEGGGSSQDRDSNEVETPDMTLIESKEVSQSRRKKRR